MRVFASIAELLIAQGGAEPPWFEDFHLQPVYAFDARRGGRLRPPYSQNFCQLSILRAAGERPAAVFFTPPEAPAPVLHEATGFVFYFAPGFAPLPPAEFAATFSFFNPDAAPVLTLGNGVFDELAAAAEALLLENRETLGASYRPVVQAHLLIFLHKCKAAWQRRDKRATHQPRAAVLAGRFQQLADRHFLTHRTVADYARLLGVTPGHLNDSVKEALGENAGAVLAKRFLAEAKNLLTVSNKEVAQIGRELGFSDPSHFGKFFKRGTGETPAAFRRKQKDSRPDLF